MHISSKVIAAASVVAVAVPGVATATSHSTGTVKAKAEKACRAQLKKEGTKKFEARYKAKSSKAAMGKCVSAYEKKHKA